MPSVQRLSGQLTSRHTVEYVLREFQSIVGSLTHDAPAKVFKLVENASVEHETLYLPYTPARAPTQVRSISGIPRAPTQVRSISGTPRQGPRHRYTPSRVYPGPQHRYAASRVHPGQGPDTGTLFLRYTQNPDTGSYISGTPQPGP